MRKILSWLLAALILAMPLTSLAESEEAAAATPGKIRTIITTDGEIDDQCSLVRYMVYANMFELSGLVSSSSRFHYTTKKDEEFKGMVSNQRWIDAYAEVYDYLCENGEGFPTPEYLTSINVEGNVTSPGEYGIDTPGSLLIYDCIMDDRDDLLFLQVWGGTNTIASALRKIEEDYKDTDEWDAIYQKVCNKIQIWIDLDQDETLNEYILPHWPDVKVIISYDQFWAFGYPWQSNIPTRLHQYFDDNFMRTYIANDSNPLSQIYLNNLTSMHGGSDEDLSFLSEGDTPNFFYILNNGLRSWEDPSYGGWAGRFTKVRRTSGDNTLLAQLYVETCDDGDEYKPVYRWMADFQNEFAARLEWTYKHYDECNHDPVVTVLEGNDLTVEPGATVTITAQTSDPDGDEVKVNFWQYGDADTYGGQVELIPGEGDSVSFVIPDDAKNNDTFHIIVEARDDAQLPITRYQRVIVTVNDPTAPSGWF